MTKFENLIIKLIVASIMIMLSCFIAYVLIPKDFYISDVISDEVIDSLIENELLKSKIFAKDELVVVDGDTIRWHGELARIEGLDTPEIWSAKCKEERVAGYEAALKLDVKLREDDIKIIRNKRKDKYGRLLIRVYINGIDISNIAVREGWARAYTGRTARRGWC